MFISFNAFPFNFVAKKIIRITSWVFFQSLDAGVDTGTVGLTRGQPGSSCSVLSLRSNTLFWNRAKMNLKNTQQKFLSVFTFKKKKLK